MVGHGYIHAIDNDLTGVKKGKSYNRFQVLTSLAQAFKDIFPSRKSPIGHQRVGRLTERATQYI